MRNTEKKEMGLAKQIERYIFQYLPPENLDNTSIHNVLGMCAGDCREKTQI